MAINPIIGHLTNEVYLLDDQDFFIGDQLVIAGSVVGGSDVFSGASNVCGYKALGDAEELQGYAKGGNDRFVGGSNSGYTDGFFPDNFQSNSIDSGSGDFFGQVIFAGDAACMGDYTTGGNDSIVGGTNSGNQFYGDALEVAWGSSKGGNDTIIGGNAFSDDCEDYYYGGGDSSNYIVGDSEDMYDMAKGGADSLTGGSATSTQDGYAVASNQIYGDSYGSEGMTTGGIDKITGGSATLSGDGYAAADNMLAGDSYWLECGAKGGADTMLGGSLTLAGSMYDEGMGFVMNMMVGDAAEMYGAIGGADTMTGGSVTDNNTGCSTGYAVNMMAGDAFSADYSTYGADKLTGGSAAAGSDGFVINVMFGDVGSYDSIQSFGFESGSGDGEHYANDQLFGGNGQVVNVLVGDTDEMYCGDVGGNDKITAGKTVDTYLGSGDFYLPGFGYIYLDLGSGDGQNLMVGDAQSMGWGSQGGNDTLVSGTGDDMMFGDAMYCNEGTGGADRFVFAVGNGMDVIGDFSVEEGDKIDLSALKYNPQIRSFAGMNALATDRIVSDGGDGTIIHLDPIWSDSSNTIHLVGVAPEELTAACFIFG